MHLLTVGGLRKLVNEIGLSVFLRKLIDAMENDFSRWHEFRLSPRHAIHYPHGVFELMPCADDNYYSFKYVNGHPRNTQYGKPSIVALGMLADVETGFPVLISEMTILTAMRTAAVAALGSRYLARDNSHTLAVIGCGAQSEFQVLAMQQELPIQQVRCFDIDAAAISKFECNLQGTDLSVVPCDSVESCIENADVIVTATAAKTRAQLFSADSIRPGLHIHSLGGDCAGKTELDPLLLKKSKLVVEYLDQSREEGEIQNQPDIDVHAELWQLVRGEKPGRLTDDEITLFDAVGIAVEDYSVLRLVHELARETGFVKSLDMLPDLSDPKDLFGLLSDSSSA